MPEPTPHPDRRPVIALGCVLLAVALVVIGRWAVLSQFADRNEPTAPPQRFSDVSRDSPYLVLDPQHPTAVARVTFRLDPRAPVASTTGLVSLSWDPASEALPPIDVSMVRADGRPVTLEVANGIPGRRGLGRSFVPFESCGPAICRADYIVTVRYTGTSRYESYLSAWLDVTYPSPYPSAANGAVSVEVIESASPPAAPAP